MIHTVSPKPFVELFERTFGEPTLVLRSPGRINVLGEHTDYNKGFVMPAAIDKEMILIFRKNDLRKIRIFIYGSQEPVVFEINDSLCFDESNGLANYIIGSYLKTKDYINQDLIGFDILFGGDIPPGVGMGASSALVCGTVFGLNILFGLEINKLNLVYVANQVEREFMGIPSGIMDQYPNIYGVTNHFLKISCLDMSHKAIISHMPDYRILVIDSGIRRANKYQDKLARINDCQKLRKVIAHKFPEASSLSLANESMLLSIKNDIPDDLFRLGTYIMQENQRVILGAEWMEKGRMNEFGKLMNKSYQKMKELIGGATDEVSFLVEEAAKSHNLLGARIMGGGLGGSTINLFKDYDTEEFISKLKKNYKKKCKQNLVVYKIKLAKGTSVLPLK